MKENLELSQKIKEIIENFHPKSNEISLAVIDLKNPELQIAGYNMDHFIYPASIYKVFVGAEILRQIDSGQRKLEDTVEITPVNEVDKDNPKFFPKSTHRDRHTVDGISNAGKSIFNSGENISELIRNAATKGQAVLQSNGNFQRVVDMGRNIGFDRSIGGQTSTMTIITNKAGELITSFPGK